MKKKVVGIIPARFQSSRFPGKPLAKIHGKTLIQHTYENGVKSALFDKLIVATDDERIYEEVRSFGGEAFMTSKNCLTGTDRIVELLKTTRELDDYEWVINLQGDEPLVEPQVIQKVLDALQEPDFPKVSTAVLKVDREETHLKEGETTSIVKCVFDLKRNALYFSRAKIPAQKKGTSNEFLSYYRHVGIYGFRRDFLLTYSDLEETPLQKIEDLEQLKILEQGTKIRVAIVDSLSVGVDNPDDIQKVEELLCKQNISS